MPTPGPRATYRYSDVFKATAVRLSQLPGVSVGDVAELKALREVKRKYERLQVEHDLLKKAIAFTSARKTTSSPSSPTTRKTTR